jgi:hypothetical protein
VSLPSSAPIPQQHWSQASVWIPVFGRDLVAAFFSRDWMLREAALQRLGFELAAIFRTWQENSHQHQGLYLNKFILTQVNVNVYFNVVMS